MYCFIILIYYFVIKGQKECKSYVGAPHTWCPLLSEQGLREFSNVAIRNNATTRQRTWIVRHAKLRKMFASRSQIKVTTQCLAVM